MHAHNHTHTHSQAAQYYSTVYYSPVQLHEPHLILLTSSIYLTDYRVSDQYSVLLFEHNVIENHAPYKVTDIIILTMSN